MNHNYLNQFRNLRDDFKQFQHESPNEDPMRTLEEIWIRPSVVDLESTNELGRGMEPPLFSSHLETLVSIPSSNSTSCPNTRPSLSDEEINLGSVLVMGGHTEEVNDTSVDKHVGNYVSQHSRPRKGHKKSRQGCYNCKRRKIKVLWPPTRDQNDL